MSRRTSLRRWSLAAASAASLLALAPSSARAQFSSVTFFGDSFSDMGMADVLSAIAGLPDQTPTPPYWPGPPPLNFPGTATNGPTWTALFASMLGRAGDERTAIGLPPGPGIPVIPTGNNFAISGARTGTFGTGGFPIGLLSQLGLFAGITPPGAPPLPIAPRAVDPTGLYVVWAGVNDIRDLADAAPPDALPAIQTAVGNVAFAVRQLALGGARSLLVPLAPNSSMVPEVALDPAAAARRAAYTQTFNTLLQGALGQLAAQFPAADFRTFDLDPIYAAIIADAARGGATYGITNVAIPCFGVPGLVPPSDCDRALFADALHPTTRAHRLVAGVALAAVVPEPATLALVAGGLAVLAVGARRARRG